jgi:hypothetical protein
LLPDGQAIFFGANGNTAYYSPATDTWSAGPAEPTIKIGSVKTQLVAADAPGAMLPDGDVLLALSPIGKLSSGTYDFPSPTYIFDFNPQTGKYVNVTPAGGLDEPSFQLTMLSLPTGQVLLDNESGSVEIYTSSGFADPAWQPEIDSVTNNNDGTFTVTGTKLNGISEGAAYGDDNEMASNYPIVQLVNGAGQVFYARTFDWTSTGVELGSSVNGAANSLPTESASFTLPAGFPLGTYSLYVVASGISSAPVTFANTLPTQMTLRASTTAPVYGQSVTFTATVRTDPPSSVTPSGTVSFVVDGNTYAGPITLTGGTASITERALGVGPHTVTANYFDSSGQFISSSGTLVHGLTVAAAPLTVTADALSNYYGDPVPSLTYTVSGFVNGDTSAVLTGMPVLSTSATSTSSAGIYAITVGLGTLAAANYDFPNLMNGNLTINKVDLTVTATSGSMTYGSQVPTLAASISGFVNGDGASVLSGMPSLSTSATPSSPAGTYEIVVTQGTLTALNYDFPNLIVGTMTVNPAPLTVTVTSESMVYGSPVPTLVASITGFVNGDMAAVVGGAAALTTAATSSSSVGSYPIIIALGTLSAANYDFPTLIGGTLIVNPAALTVTATTQSMLYGGTVPALAVTISGFVNGDTASVVSGTPVLTTSATATSGVGSYPITVAFGTLSASNYDFPNLVAAALIVTPVPLEIIAKSATRLINHQNPTLTLKFVGFVNGDTAASLSRRPTLSTTATTASPAGSYPIVVGGASSPNYMITYMSGTLSVRLPPPVTVTRVTPVLNKQRQLTQIVITLSNKVITKEAQALATYRLATAGSNGSYTAKNATIIKLKSAVYNSAKNTITLMLLSALNLSKSVQLQVNGQHPSGLQDIYSRYINGGTSAIAVISKTTTTLTNAIVAPVERRLEH